MSNQKELSEALGAPGSLSRTQSHNTKKRNVGARQQVNVAMERSPTDISQMEMPPAGASQLNTSLRDILDEPYLLNRRSTIGDAFSIRNNDKKGDGYDNNFVPLSNTIAAHKFSKLASMKNVASATNAGKKRDMGKRGIPETNVTTVGSVSVDSDADKDETPMEKKMTLSIDIVDENDNIRSNDSNNTDKRPTTDNNNNNNNNNNNSNNKRSSSAGNVNDVKLGVSAKSPTFHALNTARKKIVDTISNATRHDRAHSTQQFPIDTVCHPKMEVSMKEKMLELAVSESNDRNETNAFAFNNGENGNFGKKEIMEIDKNGLMGQVSGAASGAASSRNSQALSPHDIGKIEEFHLSGDVFDLSAGLRSGALYRYNFRPISYVAMSCILVAVEVYGSLEYFGMMVACFQGALFVIGCICHCLGIHKKYAKIDTNFFDFALNVDNTYLLVPAPYGVNLVFGWAYISFVLYLANKANEANWVRLCSDDDYGNAYYVANGSCLVRHACFSILMMFGAFSFGTAIILLPKVSSRSQKLAIEAKMKLMQKFPSAQEYFERVRESIQKRVNYIIDYRIVLNTFCCGKRSFPWLAILIMLFIVPIALGILYVESNFYTGIDDEHISLSKLIFWLSVPVTALTLFGGFSVVWRLYNLYKINFLTMRSLRRAIIADSVVDLVEWWEVRKFYLFYVMPIRYTFGTYGFMYVFMLSTVLILAAFYMVVFYGQVWQYIFGQGAGFLTFVSTLGLVTAMLRIMSMAVAVHIAQRSHVKMLEHERVRLEYLAVVYSYQHESQNQHAHALEEIVTIAQNCRKLVIGMIDLIDNHDTTPRIMGIPMRPAVLAAFFTYVIAATVSIVSKVIVS